MTSSVIYLEIPNNTPNSPNKHPFPSGAGVASAVGIGERVAIFTGTVEVAITTPSDVTVAEGDSGVTTDTPDDSIKIA